MEQETREEEKMCQKKRLSSSGLTHTYIHTCTCSRKKDCKKVSESKRMTMPIQSRFFFLRVCVCVCATINHKSHTNGQDKPTFFLLGSLLCAPAKHALSVIGQRKSLRLIIRLHNKWFWNNRESEREALTPMQLE